MFGTPVMHPTPPPRYAPSRPLPPYSYVPGHGLPHPVSDRAGHRHVAEDGAWEPPLSPGPIPAPPTEPAGRRRALAAALAANPGWLHAVDLFNEGFYWEAHEAWEGFWHALGRTTPEARFIQGLIHLAAACVKVREGRAAGVGSHARRARQLVGEPGAAPVGDALSLARDSLDEVLVELEGYTPACWHTSRTPVVRVLATSLRLAG